MPMRWTLARIVMVVVIAIVLIVAFIVYNQPCSSVRIIDASIKVRTVPNRLMLGLNADTDALKFGAISPGMVATRKVNVQHPEPATVSITMAGELSPWTAISPPTFELGAGEIQEVIFDVEVPIWAAVGNYSGKAVFCISEK